MTFCSHYFTPGHLCSVENSIPFFSFPSISLAPSSALIFLPQHLQLSFAWLLHPSCKLQIMAMDFVMEGKCVCLGPLKISWETSSILKGLKEDDDLSHCSTKTKFLGSRCYFSIVTSELCKSYTWLWVLTNEQLTLKLNSWFIEILFYLHSI